MDPTIQRAVCLELVREVLERGEEMPLLAHGLSMGHTVSDGEWVVARRLEPAGVRPGDIVLHPVGTTFVAHRGIRCWQQNGERYVLTKGDGHFAADTPVRAADLAGRVVGIRRGGRVLRLDSRAGRLFSRLLLAHSLAVWRLHRLVRRSRGTQAAPRPPVRRRPRLRAALLLPQKALVGLWNRLARRSPP
jgi:hypothetical protein